jgi:hypothetical protein
MIELKIKIEERLLLDAHKHEKLRSSCKEYLIKVGKDFDKFTIVSHDSFIGYITELAVKHYIQENYKDKKIKVTTWEDNFEIEKIINIIEANSTKEEDIKYVQEYFYDQYDLKLESIANTKIILIDIKTAFTKREPAENWNFMYPVIQAQKPGKDFMVLTYYVTNSDNIEDVKKIVLIGYISEGTIRNCKIIKKGEKTRFGTLSQIDNYETELSVHYQNIDKLLETF